MGHQHVQHHKGTRALSHHCWIVFLFEDVAFWRLWEDLNLQIVHSKLSPGSVEDCWSELAVAKNLMITYDSRSVAPTWKVEHIAAEIFMNSAPGMVFSCFLYLLGWYGMVVMDLWSTRSTMARYGLNLPFHYTNWCALSRLFCHGTWNRFESERRWFGSAFWYSCGV